MRRSNKALYAFVGLSLLLGIFVAIYPLSSSHRALRPELVCLLVIFWIIHSPQNLGVAFAWLIGLTQDLFEGVVWGAHAAALALVAYVCILAYQRIKNYSVWHQTMWIFVLVGIHQIIVNWFQGLAGYKQAPQELIIATVITALFWPIIYFVLNRLLYKARLN